VEKVLIFLLVVRFLDFLHKLGYQTIHILMVAIGFIKILHRQHILEQQVVLLNGIKQVQAQQVMPSPLHKL